MNVLVCLEQFTLVWVKFVVDNFCACLCGRLNLLCVGAVSGFPMPLLSASDHSRATGGRTMCEVRFAIYSQ